MSTVEITKYVEGSPQLKTRLVAAYYLLSIVAGLVFFFMHGRLALATDLIAAAFYLGATALFYGLSAGAARRDQHAPRDS